MNSAGRVKSAYYRSEEWRELRSTFAAEQERADVRAAREAWFEAQPKFDPDQLVFLDETAAATSMARRYGWAPRGERCRLAAPQGHVWTPPRVQAVSLDKRCT